MAQYEVTRQRHVEYLMSRLPAHVERLSWSAERVRDEQTARLRGLLATARTHSPWHRSRLAGIDIEAMDADRLAALPVMSKRDLMIDFDDIVTDRRVTLDLVNAHLAILTTDAYLLDELHAVASGGSSGVRGVFVWGWEAWAEAVLVNHRRQVDELTRDPQLAARPPVNMFVTADNASHFTSAAVQTFATPAIQSHRFPVTWPLAAIVDGLNRTNGTGLITYASMLGTLVAEARAGRLTISPLRIVTTAEPLLPEIRAAAAAVWDAPIANLWGTSEGGIMAIGCFRAPGMHLAEDLLIFEAVDEDGRPVAPGRPSAKIYLTNLFNPLLPLIRYEISDQITLLDEPCICGSAYRRIADIQGRHDDLFAYPGGVVVHPHIFRSILGRHAAIVEYQVRQTPRGADVCLRTHDAIDAPRIEQQLADELLRLGCRDPVVAVQIVEALPRHGIGKLKRFIPQPNPDGDKGR